MHGVHRPWLAAFVFALACRAPSSSPSVTVPSATASVVPVTIAASPTPPRSPCATKGYVAPTGAHPTLSLALRGANLDVTYGNSGTDPVCLLAYVSAEDEQFDWLALEVTDGAGVTRKLQLTDDRNRSARISVELASGATYTKTIDLTAWAARPRNGGKALGAGPYRVRTNYDSKAETWAWAGKLHADTK